MPDTSNDLLANAEPSPTTLAGGALPSVGDLFTDTMTEFTENIGPYALGGLSLFLITIPLAFIMIIGIYACIGMGMVLMMGGMVTAMAILPEDLAIIGALLSELLGLGGMVVLMAAAVAGMTAVLAPINASLVRAVRAQQQGGTKVDLSSAFSSVTQDLPAVIGTSLAIATMALVLAMFCYLPALLVVLFFGFATTMVALHGTSPIVTLRSCATHVTENLNWHLQFAVVAFAITMIAGYVPVIGSMFALSFYVRAYRTIFGDADAPVLTVA